MPRKRTKAAKQAHALLVWLESLELPARVINALRRDLEVVTGERDGEEGGGVLAGIDQARFTEELYQKRGGQVGKVPSVAASAIEALRAAIPALVSGGAIEAAQPVVGDAALESAEATRLAQRDEPADAALESTEEAQGDEAPDDAAQEGDKPAPEFTPEAMPAVTDAALADAQEELIAEAAREATEGTADIAPEAGTELVDTLAAPKRRGRPPRAVVAADTEEPAEAPAAPARRPGRPRRDEAALEAAAELPPRTRRTRVAAVRDAAQQAAPSMEAPAPAVTAPAAPVADPSFAVLLRLWRELHPQGQRAAMHFMADLAAGS